MAIRRDKSIEVNGITVDGRTEIYTSAEAVAVDCRNRPVRISQYKLDNVHKSWHGVNNYDEALELLANGYQPTVDELRTELKVNPGTGPRFAFKNELQGFIPIVPLALKGIPNCMVNMHIRPMKAKVIDVYYDMTARSGTEPEEFIKAGKMLLGAVIALEKQGYRFNLYALQTYYGSCGNKKTADFLCIKIKSSDRPLDLKRMSFPLTHPAFFRVIGFDWQGKSPITRDIGYGRGCALSYRFSTEDQRKIITTMFGDNAFYLSCSALIDNDYNEETLKEELTNAKVAS